MSVESPPQAPSFGHPGQHDIISEIFNLDLFAPATQNDSHPSSASNDSSPQSQYSHLATPSPINDPLHTFPQTHPGEWDFSSMFGGDQMKDDIFGSGSAVLSAFEPSPMVDANYAQPTMGIDPQLMESPTAETDESPEPATAEEQQSSPPEPQPAPKTEEKIMLTIQPVKAAGHGSKRQGTVASGGITKTRASRKAPPPSPVVHRAPSPTPSDDMMGEEDWRPSPEVLAKMSSKEKRQLRNKISARNFRIRRKEYITHLEFDIAERDRLLDAIRTDLTSTQSENQALRKEVEALKQALLAGRSGAVELPPPKELVSVQEMMEATSGNNARPSTPPSSSDDNLVKPNTQKDLSPNANSAFWGGWGMGGGVTPVHTVLVPSPFEKDAQRKDLQENINPAMNENLNPNLNARVSDIAPKAGFDGFADREMFTMKSLDAYRMHLWSKMAASHPQQQRPTTPYSPSSSHTSPSPPSSPSPFYTGPAANHSPYLSGLAGALRPAYFKAPVTSPSLSSLLSGKHSGSGLSSMSSLAAALPTPKEERAKLPSAHEEKQHKEAAAAAMVASQTVLGKLGSAFWDAFSGSNSGSASSSHGASLDSDKVRRVLEGKAVLKVVDVDTAPTQAPKSPSPSMASLKSSTSALKPIRPTIREKRSSEKCASTMSMTDMLEESMRSLSLGRRA
ncbi:uncharacterized protein SCHCODRAFT_02637307 [Schizophyllum commune H4-8]|nr:uncharacterized protein SCHCODRAFT_02637307 [Schizophyllum commune H4-8]KAI5888648.1 hypothetical protein SCHCODRAFT_02637307 [Schizophyllum commune H4-8]